MYLIIRASAAHSTALELIVAGAELAEIAGWAVLRGRRTDSRCVGGLLTVRHLEEVIRKSISVIDIW